MKQLCFHKNGNNMKTMICRSSLDYSIRGLSIKKREAIKKLKNGEFYYNAYVPKMDGSIIKFEASNNKQGYKIKTLKPEDFILI